MNDRRVHFSEPIHQVEYLEEQWETASQLARDGSGWLLMSLDRQRFQDRIERTGEILNKILDLDFRQQIYRERFKNFVISDKQNITRFKTNDTTSTSATIELSPASGISVLEGADIDADADIKQQQSLEQSHCPQQQQHRLNNKRGGSRRNTRKRNRNNRCRKRR